MEISMNTLMLALKAIQRDIDRHRMLANGDDLSEEDADYYGSYVLDLSRALGELGDVYELARATTPEAPSLDQLLDEK